MRRDSFLFLLAFKNKQVITFEVYKQREVYNFKNKM